MVNNYYPASLGFQVTVKRSFDYAAGASKEWDELVSSSSSDFMFQTFQWLHACIDTYCDGAQVLVPEVRKNGKLVAAAAFRERNGIIEFAGIDRSDMCDLVLSRDLDEGEAIEATHAMLIAARNASPRFRYFLLRRLPVENNTVRRLRDGRFGLYPRVQSCAVAPSMEMMVASEKLRKKSLRRHENGLMRAGKLESHTLTRAADILPRLETFFDQHLERWAETPTPSLFLDEKNRQFYRRVIQNLDDTDCLRFTVLELDGQMIAAHFGWLYGGRFSWYKPSFDINRRKYSPGEVLLKRTIEQAVADNADEFDFLLGNEAYKSRFATKERQLVSVVVDTSWLAATVKRIRQRISRGLGGSDQMQGKRA